MEKNIPLDQKWVCVQVTHRYNKTQHVKTVKSFLKTLFTDDKVLFLGSQLDNQNFNNVMEGYFFIQCDDITPYIQIFRNSKYINNILVDFQRIEYISGQQIANMVKQYELAYDNRKNHLKYGDVVKIKKGMFKNLYAIVVQVKNQHQIIGVFKFISGYRFQLIDLDNCEKCNNLFDFVRVAII